MTSSPESLPEPTPGRYEALDLATAQLRERPLPRVVEIADDVMRSAWRTPRRAFHVRARTSGTLLTVSSTALTTLLRADVDDRLVGAALGRVRLEPGDDERLGAVTLELFVQYGTPILELADQARTIARETLARALGPETVGDSLDVTVHHVHVSDVTLGDPHLVDPGDDE